MSPRGAGSGGPAAPGTAPAWSPPRSLYVHVPFCRSKCAYCDFHSGPLSAAPEGLAARIVEASLGRIDALAARFGSALGPGGGTAAVGSRFDTVYVGGGTPTVLPRPLLARLLEGLAERAGAPREWTVEANPESLDAEALAIFRGAGATRISLGTQSLDDGLLRLLGRPADAAACESALRLAASSGLAVSADLMAGLPRRTRLRDEAARLLDLGAGHLSVYDLVLEEGTPLEARYRGGELELPGEDEAADERGELEDFLASRGFRRYEVSNYAPPGAESLHNLAYWRMDSYLGVGPGAVSTLQAAGPPGASLRIEEEPSLEAYAMGDPAARGIGRSGTAAPGGRPAMGLETAIPPREAAFEAVMMGFRTVFGVDARAFEARFGLALEAFVGRSLEAWAGRLAPAAPWPEGSPVASPRPSGELALDGRGLDLLNRFLSDCLGEIEGPSPSSAF